MRPLKLTMQAFGPYAGTEHIDFTQLGTRTMFVISGKTGSGKTTIFDGISYAIYGKASGEDRNGSDLRSQFANVENLTEVSLEFTQRGKTYYIHRTPQQEKKKDRGDGFTTINAKAELYIYEKGTKQLIASNVREVDEKIKEIMLIDSNQFRQILMIPQGEFRKLLTSDSKEKESILQRLFHTEVYKKVEDKLKEEALILKKSVEKEVDNRNHAIRNIKAKFQEELKSQLNEEPFNDTIILPLLKEEIKVMHNHYELLNRELVKKEAERDQLQQQLIKAEAIKKQLSHKKQLMEHKEHLESQKRIFDEKQKEITLAQKAALLAQQEELCHRLRKDLNEIEKELETLVENLDKINRLLESNNKELERELNREVERIEATEHLNSLKNMMDDVQALARMKENVIAVEKQRDEILIKKSDAEVKFKKIDEQSEKLLQEKEAIQKEQITFLENEKRLTNLHYELEKITKYSQSLARYEASLVDYNKKKDFFQKEEARYIDGKSLREALEQKWLHGQASLLASQLTNGSSCPVCGSLEHPNPATGHLEEIPTDADMKAAKKQESQLEQGKSKAESAYLEAQSKMKSWQSAHDEWLQAVMEIRNDFSPLLLEGVQQQLMSEKAFLIKKQEQLSKRKDRLSLIEGQIIEVEEIKKKQLLMMEQVLKEIQELEILFAERNATYHQMLQKVPDELRSIEAFEQAFLRAEKKKEELDKRLEDVKQRNQELKDQRNKEEVRIETVQKQKKEVESKLSIERAIFLQNMNSQGFNVYSEYNEAKKSELAIQNLEEEVRTYREEYRSVCDRYQDLANVLEGIEDPDTSSIITALEDIKSQITNQQNKRTDLLMGIRDNQNIYEKIVEINASMKDLEEKYSVIGELYEISKGQNTYRITFERFVLASFLDDILREANGRLLKMTSGRYELRRKTDRSKGNVQSGLELLVLDQYTGQQRHVKTLSGGESFKASLSLALGLADVVQQYAGGVSLETMFIDEGFGTLDPESLDQAIETLMDIQSSGRLVGIISHVPELKERIDARLEVIGTQVGSRTEFHFLNS